MNIEESYNSDDKKKFVMVYAQLIEGINILKTRFSYMQLIISIAYRFVSEVVVVFFLLEVPVDQLYSIVGIVFY